MRQPCVWVLEIAVLSARNDRIIYWEIWDVFALRSDAVKKRNREMGAWSERKVPKPYWRIRKYIPCPMGE